MADLVTSELLRLTPYVEDTDDHAHPGTNEWLQALRGEVGSLNRETRRLNRENGRLGRELEPLQGLKKTVRRLSDEAKLLRGELAGYHDQMDLIALLTRRVNYLAIALRKSAIEKEGLEAELAERPLLPAVFRRLRDRDKTIASLRKANERLGKKIKVLRALNARLEARIAKLRTTRAVLSKALYGSKSGKQDKARSERKRGQQRGAPGHSRTQRPTLEEKEERHSPPQDARVCSCCGKPYVANGELSSTVIEIEVKAHIRRIVRLRYRRGCDCASSPLEVAAPPVPRLFPVSNTFDQAVESFGRRLARSAQPTCFLPQRPFTSSAHPGHHGLAERLLRQAKSWRGGWNDPLRPHPADSGHLAQAFRLGLDDIEDLLAERPHKPAGVDRADAPDHARAEILLDALDRRRRSRADETRLELLVVGTVARTARLPVRGHGPGLPLRDPELADRNRLARPLTLQLAPAPDRLARRARVVATQPFLAQHDASALRRPDHDLVPTPQPHPQRRRVAWPFEPARSDPAHVAEAGLLLDVPPAFDCIP